MRLINADKLYEEIGMFTKYNSNRTNEEWIKLFRTAIDDQPTIDIKTAAFEQGYYLNKKERYEPFLPCTCGHNKREHWTAPDGYFYKCINCWKKGPVGKTDKEARHLWNEMIRKEMENGD